MIRKFESLDDGNLFYAERLQARYSKDQVEIVVMLYEEPIFKENFPQFFAQSVI